MLPRRAALVVPLAAAASTLPLSKSAGAVTYADYMLHLINIERRKAGVDSVVLGTNRAAQMHANMMVKFCYTAHWGVDGLKPYMRYSLTGGYQTNAENVGAYQACYLDTVANGMATSRGSIALAVHKFVIDFMSSTGHKATMLDKWNKKVNIGLAWDAHNITCSNQFEGDYVHFSKIPAIEDGHLSMIGRTRKEIVALDPPIFIALVTYDPPPHLLTIGQLDRTRSYSDGKIIGYIAPPNVGSITGVTQGICLSPYDLPEDTVVAESSADVDTITRHLPLVCPEEVVTAPTLRADEWATGNDSFAIDADISSLLSKWGDGVYTVILVHAQGGVEFSKYSIFYGVEPPAGYE